MSKRNRTRKQVQFADNTNTAIISADRLDQEIATRDKVEIFFSTLYGILDNPDPVLQKTGQSIAIYHSLRRDSHVSSCITNRKSGALSRKGVFETGDGDQKVTDLLNGIFGKMKMINIMREILDAILFGYQTLEVVWTQKDGLIVPDRIVGKPQEWFWFDPNNNLHRADRGLYSGVPVEPRKFLLVQHNASYVNPYGEGLLGTCFWPVTFKRGGIKFWTVFLEKFGMPHAIATYVRGKDASERMELLTSLQRMVRDACAVFPQGTDVKLLEAANGSGSSDIYEKHAKYHDSEISKVILGHASAMEATPGKLGGEDQSIKVRDDLIDSDCLLIEETIDQVVNWMAEFNPSFGTILPKFKLKKKQQIDKTLAERDYIVSQFPGVSFSPDYLKRAHGYGDGDIIVSNTPRPDPSAPVQFSEPQQFSLDAAQKAVDELLAKVNSNDPSTTLEKTLKPIFELRNTSKSYKEFNDGLAALYPDMDASDVIETIEKIDFLAQVWGMFNVQAETK